MNSVDFNEPAERARYTYRKNPMYDRSFQVLKWDEGFGEYVPFGDYTSVDESEAFDLLEKKVINLISALNERTNLVELGDQTGVKTYFHVSPVKSGDGKSKVIFYTNAGEGISKENAVFTFEGEIDE